VKSQTSIPIEKVADQVGDSVKVCGRVAGIRFLENATSQLTLINMGGAYPNQLLTIVIGLPLRKQFEKTPEELFTDKDVCITGNVVLYKNKPQIVLTTKEQVVLL
jgi:hypothetical protein